MNSAAGFQRNIEMRWVRLVTSSSNNDFHVKTCHSSVQNALLVTWLARQWKHLPFYMETRPHTSHSQRLCHPGTSNFIIHRELATSEDWTLNTQWLDKSKTETWKRLDWRTCICSELKKGNHFCILFWRSFSTMTKICPAVNLSQFISGWTRALDITLSSKRNDS